MFYEDIFGRVIPMSIEKNTVAVIWDFDKTLGSEYMQEPIFNRYKINSDDFWREVNDLSKKYQTEGIKINRDTIYLNHMLTCVNQGIFKGLNNRMLFELGKEIKFFPGATDILKELKLEVANVEKYKTFGIHVENYIVSTGLTSMIRGSKIAEDVDDIWGCEFIEQPIRSELDIKTYERNLTESPNEIRQIGYIIDNTSKTRAIFEINKGANKFEYVDVNSKMTEDNRRVPFENMIYIADGPSDVPVFSLLKENGGKTFAVYPKSDMKAFQQVDALQADGRIDAYAPADYTEGSQANMWLKTQVLKIAESIFEWRTEEMKRVVSKPPSHLT